MTHLDDAARLRKKGYRLTPQRLVVLEVIQRAGGHLTAEAVHAAIVGTHPYINIATVYRTLQWLYDVGLVAPIAVVGEPIRYEYVDGSAHHHLICRGCGGEQEIGDDILSQLKHQLLERYGFEAKLSHLALMGQCDVCRGNGNGAGPMQEQ